jgi:RNA polymerase sigma-70 factor (ECF subfamily)
MEEAVVSARSEASNAEASDGSLLRRFREGDQDAATQIYLRYARRLRALARANCSAALASRLDADDIVQSVFRTFFRGASKGGYDVPAGQELWKLLLVIALNKIRSHGCHHNAAKRDVRKTTTGEDVDKVEAVFSHRDAEAYAMLRLVIDDTLKGLPAVVRRIIELRIEGFEMAEIAARTGRAQRTIERNLQEFRKKLSKLLEAG